MRRLTVALVLLCTLHELSVTSRGDAQITTGTTTLRGVTFDSLSGKPLSTATVRIIGRAGAAISDSKGRFRFDSLAAGSYMLVMEHPRVDSIGLNEIIARTTVPDNRREVQMSVAIPSFETLWSGACRIPSTPFDQGILYGAIREPSSQGGVDGARVAVSWIEIGVDAAKKLKQTRFTLNTETDSTGSYIACGVPVDVPLQVTAGVDSASQITVDLPSQNLRVLRRDILIGLSASALAAAPSGADSTRGGTGVVRGTVLSVTGEPMENVRIGVDGVELTRTNSAGEFIANGVRAGTRLVAFVSIGSEPVTKLVDVVVDQVATTSATMARVTLMDAFVVRGRRVAQTVKDFEKRKLQGFGSIKDSTELDRYPTLESALRISRGVTIDSRTHEVYLPDRGSLCAAMLFLDWRRVDTEQLLPLFIKDIAWIEVYPRWYDVPFEFSQGKGCGAVVIFTKYAISG